jgi:hypothetical protein
VPSSISSSEVLRGVPGGAAQRDTSVPSGGHDRYARQTAADRPGVAQPVPVRPVPVQPWGRIVLGAALILALLLAGWEAYWRAYGVTPSIANNNGLWAIQRRRIDAGEGDATVIVGSSRTFFDIQLPVWERLAGRRPIQLSFEGTSPLVFVEDLAADPHFTGRLIMGIDPQVFFQGFDFHVDAPAYARKESPSKRIGQWLSMHLIEPYLAFDDDDFALETVLERQPWPPRPGKPWFTQVRKLANTEADRNTYMWSKVASDPQYRELARSIWRQRFEPATDPPAEKLRKTIQEQIDRMAKAVAKLRARGVRVLFVRSPSDGEYLAYERRLFPRATTWDALLAASGASGIHFEDYPELKRYYLPEWSHMSRAEAKRYTVALYGVIERDFWGPRAAATAAGASAAGSPPAGSAAGPAAGSR